MMLLWAFEHLLLAQINTSYSENPSLLLKRQPQATLIGRTAQADNGLESSLKIEVPHAQIGLRIL